MVVVLVYLFGIECFGKVDMWYFDWFYCFVLVFLYQVDDVVWQVWQEIGDICYDDVGDWMVFGCGGDFVGEYVDNYQCMGFGVLKLVCYFVGCIEWIDVYKNVVGFQNVKGGDWKWQVVGYLQGNLVVFGEVCDFVQVDCKGI